MLVSRFLAIINRIPDQMTVLDETRGAIQLKYSSKWVAN